MSISCPNYPESVNVIADGNNACHYKLPILPDEDGDNADVSRSLVTFGLETVAWIKWTLCCASQEPEIIPASTSVSYMIRVINGRVVTRQSLSNRTASICSYRPSAFRFYLHQLPGQSFSV